MEISLSNAKNKTILDSHIQFRTPLFYTQVLTNPKDRPSPENHLYIKTSQLLATRFLVCDGECPEL